MPAKNRRMRSEVIKCDFLATPTLAFSFDLEIEPVQFLDGEFLPLPCEIVTVGCEVPETPPSEMVAECLLQYLGGHGRCTNGWKRIEKRQKQWATDVSA